MVDAGLLANKQKLTNVELQSILTSQLGSEAKAQETMTSMGLSVAIEGEEAQTVQLTAKKLEQAVTSGILTEAQAQELAMTVGVTAAQNAQATSTMPKWIANMKAMTTATLKQVAATVKWLATNPVGWCALAVAGIAAVIHHQAKAVENAQEAIDNSISSYEDAKSELDSLNSELQTTQEKIAQLESKDKLTFTEQDELDKLKEQNNELERSIDLKKELEEAELQSSISTIVGEYDKSRKEYFNKKGAQIEDELDIQEAARNAIEDAKTWENQDGVAEYIKDQQEIIEESQRKLETYTSEALEEAKKIQKNIDIFEEKGKDNLSENELATYNQLKSDIDTIYKSVLSEGAYTEWKIEPIFEKSKFSELREQLSDYFADGGDTSIEALEQKFGKDIINSLIEACSEVGVEFNEVIDSLYAESTENTTSEALKKKFGTYLSSTAIEKSGSEKENDVKVLKAAQENLQDEYVKIEKWGLSDYADQIKNGTIQSVFGNVDMDKRTIITWSDELKQTYQDELASWDYDPEIGSIDTVFGGSGRFGESLSDNGWEVAFTPILPDGTFLSKDTVYDYIETILQQAYADDGQVTDEELKEIDAQGMQIGDTFVKGIYAGIDGGLNYDNNGNWAETVGRLMHFSGDFGAVNFAKKELNKAQSNKNSTTRYTINSAYDAKKYNQYKDVNDYIDSLSARDRNILATIDFDEDATVENLKKTLEEANKQAKEETVISNINFTSDTDSAKSAMSSLTDALADYKENGLKGIDVSKLQALNTEDTFGAINGSTESLEEFLSVMNNINSTTDEVQNAFDTLASAYLYNSQMAQQVTEDTLKVTEAQLEQMGVTNAQEVAYQMLINKEGELETAAKEAINSNLSLKNVKLDSANASEILENATSDDIIGLANEASAAGNTSTALIQLAVARMNVGTLNTSDSIQNLISLCTQLGLTVDALQEYKSALEAVGSISEYNKSSKYTYAGEKALQGKANNAITSTKAAIKAATQPKTNVSGGSASKTGGGGSGSSSSKSEIDWLERAMERTGKKIEKFKAKLENLFTVKKKSNNISEQLKLVNKEIKIATKQVEIYDKKANSVKLSKSLKNAVKNGKIKGNKKTLIAEYGETTANKISEYKEWYDKAREAEKTKEELQTTKRQLKEQQYQLYVDEAQANIDSLDAQKEISAGYAAQNQKLSEKEQYIKTLYEYQIKIAELTDDELEKAKLSAELTKELRELEKEKFNVIQDEYSSIISLLNAESDIIQAEMDQIEAKGKIVTANYYQAQINNKNTEKNDLQTELDLLTAQLAQMEKAGDVGTQNWYDAKSAIADINQQILDCDTSIINMNNSITEIANTIYDKVITGLQKVSTEADFIVGLMSDLDNFDELSHTITDVGLSNLGSYFVSKETSSKEANITKKIIEQAKKNLNDGNLYYIDALGQNRNYQSIEQMQDAIDSLYDNWREQINQTSEYNSKIIDFMREKLKQELAIVEDLINAKKEALNAEKSLYDYQKQISKSTSSIGTIQAQITALKGDSSDEAMARIQSLQKQLEDEQENLEDMQYERRLSDEQEMLDNMYDKYSDLITAESNDIKGLLEKAEKLFESNTTIIKDTMDMYADDYGYVTQSIENIFNSEGFTSFKTSLDQKLTEIINKISSQTITSDTVNNTDTNTAESETIDASPSIGEAFVRDFTSNSLATTEFTPTQVYGMTAKEVETFINKKAGKATKKKSEYPAVNQGIYEFTNGKVLSEDNRKKLAQKLGVSTSDIKSKKGDLYKALHNLSIKGFSHGGIVPMDSIEEQIKANGDKVLISANPGEEILTKYDSDSFRALINSDLIQKPNLLNDIVKNNLPDLRKNSLNMDTKVSYGDISFQFDLPNVTDSKSMLQALQTDKNLQNAVQDITIGQLNRTSRLGVNKYR